MIVHLVRFGGTACNPCKTKHKLLTTNEARTVTCKKCIGTVFYKQTKKDEK